MGTNRALWKEYETTWDAFSRDLDRLQSYVESQDRHAIEAALLDVEKSKAAHNAARDLLAEQLTGSRSRNATRLQSEEERIRQKARLLWELSGKPNGSAEADWFLAERLVRTASATT